MRALSASASRFGFAALPVAIILVLLSSGYWEQEDRQALEEESAINAAACEYDIAGATGDCPYEEGETIYVLTDGKKKCPVEHEEIVQVCPDDCFWSLNLLAWKKSVTEKVAYRAQSDCDDETAAANCSTR